MQDCEHPLSCPVFPTVTAPMMTRPDRQVMLSKMKVVVMEGEGVRG